MQYLQIESIHIREHQLHRRTDNLEDPPLHESSIYQEILVYEVTDLLTKLTEYPSPVKKEAKIEAETRNAEVRGLHQNLL